MAQKEETPVKNLQAPYDSILGEIATVIDAARRSAARSVNSIMTAAYWLIGRRIVEFEQGGEKRAAYGEELLPRLAVDLSKRFGKGFSRRNMQDMRLFYLAYTPDLIRQTLSAKSGLPPDSGIFQTPSGILQTVSAESSLADMANRFPLALVCLRVGCLR